MNLRIFALVAAIVTICTCTPVKAETFRDSKGWHRGGQGVIVMPAQKQYRLYHPYRRQNRMYRHHRDSPGDPILSVAGWGGIGAADGGTESANRIAIFTAFTI